MFKYIFPTLIENFSLYTIAGWEVYGMEIIIATLILIVFGYLNVKGTSISGRMQFIFALIMVVGVVLLTVLIGIQPSAGLDNIKPYFPTNTDRKSTRLNSSHVAISYAVFCVKKKNIN